MTLLLFLSLCFDHADNDDDDDQGVAVVTYDVLIPMNSSS